MGLRDQALATAEFLAVDVETNGRAGELCELTEVGAVLVGGGELHERFESLVRVEQPLSRGIERFTGITQAMVDGAPEPAEVLRRLAELARGKALIAHNASFDRRALKQAFERSGVEWTDPPWLCTMRLATRFAPLSRQRKLVPLAESLGIEVDGAHRALVDAETCARVFCALFPRICAHASKVGDVLEVAGPRRRAAKPPVMRRPPADRPDLSKLPDDPGVYVFRDLRGRPLYVGKSVSVRSRARSHFCAPAGWTERAEVVDYKPTNSELGALVLENRLIKAWQPAGNKQLKSTDGWLYLRCRFDVNYPVLEVAQEPAPGLAVNIGPVRGKAAAEELIGQLESLFGLRHCGRRMPRRLHPSIYGQMGHCMSPCLGDLDPNAYRRRLDEALALFEGPEEASGLLLEHIEERMREAAGERRYERAEVLRRRLERLTDLLSRLGGVLRATHASSRLVLARHPSKRRFDAFWIVGGRVRDWGPLPQVDELLERTATVLEAPPPRRAVAVPVDEVDEVRIVSSWLAANEAHQLPLDPAPGATALSELVAGAAGSGSGHAARARSRQHAL
jgi:DNA polymerase III subunit epsilon